MKTELRVCKVCARTEEQTSFWASRHRTCRECHSLRRTGRGLRCLHCGELKPDNAHHGRFCGRECHLRHWMTVDANTGCWVWIGSLDKPGGYGAVRFKVDGKTISHRAHRVSYETFRGPIGDFEILHLCHNRRCINPDHLRPGTRKENGATILKRQAYRSIEESGMNPREYALAKWRGLT